MSANGDSWTEGNDSVSFTNRSLVCDLRNEFERVDLEPSSTSEDTEDSGLECPTVSCAEGLDGSSVGAWDWTEREEDDFSSEEYHTADEDSDSTGRPYTPVQGILKSVWNCEKDYLSSSVSSCSSYKSTHSTPECPKVLQTQGFLTG